MLGFLSVKGQFHYLLFLNLLLIIISLFRSISCYVSLSLFYSVLSLRQNEITFRVSVGTSNTKTQERKVYYTCTCTCILYMYMYIACSVYKCNIACAKTCVFSRCLCDIIFPVLLLYIHVHVVLLKEELLYVFLFYFFLFCCRTNSFSTVFPPSDRPKYSRFEPPPHPPRREDWKTSKYCELCNSSLVGMVSSTCTCTSIHVVHVHVHVHVC